MNGNVEFDYRSLSTGVTCPILWKKNTRSNWAVDFLSRVTRARRIQCICLQLRTGKD